MPFQQEPTTKRKREEPEELVELAPDVVAILEAVTDMPQIPQNALDSQDHEMLSTVEEQLHSRVSKLLLFFPLVIWDAVHFPWCAYTRKISAARRSISFVQWNSNPPQLPRSYGCGH